MVLIQIKQIIAIDGEDKWANESHKITYATFWKEREEDQSNILLI